MHYDGILEAKDLGRRIRMLPAHGLCVWELQRHLAILHGTKERLVEVCLECCLDIPKNGLTHAQRGAAPKKTTFKWLVVSRHS